MNNRLRRSRDQATREMLGLIRDALESFGVRITFCSRDIVATKTFHDPHETVICVTSMPHRVTLIFTVVVDLIVRHCELVATFDEEDYSTNEPTGLFAFDPDTNKNPWLRHEKDRQAMPTFATLAKERRQIGDKEELLKILKEVATYHAQLTQS